MSGERITKRIGAPMPIGGGMKVHEFGTDTSTIEVFVGDTLSSSGDFRANGGDLLSATYNRLPDQSGLLFSVRLVHYPTSTT